MFPSDNKVQHLQNQENQILFESVGKYAQMQSTMQYREKLIELMKRVQEVGVSTKQYLRKPWMFSGTWMDGVYSTD